MKKKLSIRYGLIIFICSLLLLSPFLINKKYISAFQFHIHSSKKISQKILQDYYSSNPSVQKDAARFIIECTLENLNYHHWQEYIEYIDLSLYQAHVLPNSGGELIAVLNLSKDLAAIGIYTLQNDTYIFSHKIEELLPVQNLEFISVPHQDYQFIISEQRLDERFGALFEERYLEIFVYQNDSFQSIWKKIKYLNEIYNAQWMDPSESSEKWFQTIEDNQIEFIKNETIKISVSIHKQKREALKKSIPLPKDFKDVLDIRTEEIFYWNPDYQQFIIQKKTPYSS